MESTFQTVLRKPAMFLRKSSRAKYIAVILCLVAGGLRFPEVGAATYAIITIDVCWTCGDDFQGTWNGKDYGIPLIVEKLRAHGFNGTFFVAPYCPADLKNKMLSNLKFLLAHGQDVQLHTHPDVFDPSRKNLSMYSKNEKREILATGIRVLQEAGAPRPIAHRAGQLCIDQEMFELLAEFGIPIDSSIYTHFVDCGAPLPENVINRFAKIGDVYELPIFLIRTVPYIGHAGTTALQFDSTTWWQQKLALEQVADRKLPLVTIFLHFFSLYDRVTPDKRFDPFKVLGPNDCNIRALDNILRMLKTDERFKVVTIRELWDIHNQDPSQLDGPSFIPYPGLLPTYARSWKYLFNGSVTNIIVLVSPLIPLSVAVILALMWRKRTLSTGSRTRKND